MNNFHRFQIFDNFEFSNLFSQIWLKTRHTSLFSGICREIRPKFHQKFAEKMQNRKFIDSIAKNVPTSLKLRAKNTMYICRICCHFCENWKFPEISETEQIIHYSLNAQLSIRLSSPRPTRSSASRRCTRSRRRRTRRPAWRTWCSAATWSLYPRAFTLELIFV